MWLLAALAALEKLLGRRHRCRARWIRVDIFSCPRCAWREGKIAAGQICFAGAGIPAHRYSTVRQQRRNDHASLAKCVSGIPDNKWI